jgi:hypothetical protein
VVRPVARVELSHQVALMLLPLLINQTCFLPMMALIRIRWSEGWFGESLGSIEHGLRWGVWFIEMERVLWASESSVQLRIGWRSPRHCQKSQVIRTGFFSQGFSPCQNNLTGGNPAAGLNGDDAQTMREWIWSSVTTDAVQGSRNDEGEVAPTGISSPPCPVDPGLGIGESAIRTATGFESFARLVGLGPAFECRIWPSGRGDRGGGGYPTWPGEGSGIDE